MWHQCTIVLDNSFDVHIEGQGSPTGSKGVQQTGYVCILQNPVSETPKTTSIQILSSLQIRVQHTVHNYYASS